MKKDKIFLLVVLAILIIVGVTFLVPKGGDGEVAKKSLDTANPLVDLQIPDSLDEATKNVYQAKVDKTKKLYEESPEAWETWIAIGNLHVLFRDYEKGIASYRQSINLQSDNILGYRNIAEVYRNNLKDYEKAVEYYRLAIDNTPSDPDNFIKLIQLYRLLDQPEKAEAEFGWAMGATNNNPDVLIAIIRFYKDVGNTEKYEESARLLLELYPDNPEYQRGWGHVLE